MQGLLYGVRPERWAPPDDTNKLLVGLSHTPMVLKELDRPTLYLQTKGEKPQAVLKRVLKELSDAYGDALAEFDRKAEKAKA